MVDVKENSNGVALLEEKVMAALTQLIVREQGMNWASLTFNAPENSDLYQDKQSILFVRRSGQSVKNEKTIIIGHFVSP